MNGDIERIRAALQFIDAGDRDQWIRMGMAVKSELGDAGFDVWNEWSRQAESYDAKDARDVWKSIDADGGVTAGTLYHVAKANGWHGNGTYPKPTSEAIEARRHDAAERAAKAKAEQARKHAEAKERAAVMRAQARDASPGHPYLLEKSIGRHGVLELNGDLLVPMCDAAGNLHSLQQISPSGDKRYLSGGRKKGYLHMLGEPDGGGVLCIAEGYATAASVRAATGFPVAAAFDAYNLLPVAQALRERYPAAHLVLCADDDRDTEGNPGLTKATEAARAVGGLVAVPDFGDDRPEGATDFNDLARHCGVDAVRLAVASALAPDKAKNQPGLENAATATSVGASDIGADTDTATVDGPAVSVARLAKLSPIEYDRCREREAKALRIRLTTLDREVAKLRGETTEESSGQGTAFSITTPEPWADPVDGTELLDELAATFKRFVVLPEHGYIIAALWVLMTYAYEAFSILPLLVFCSPEKGCGKTTLRDTIAALVRSALSTDGISPAALFRVIEKWRPTVLLDDFDSWGKGNDELRGVLNTGYRRGGVYVRCVGDDQEPKGFSTFAPKCVNLIGRLHPTLNDRAIVITMRRKLRDELVESLHGFDGEALRRKCARWVFDYAANIEAARPDMAGMFNRQADNWRPLLALAVVAGGEWPKRVRTAITEIRKLDDDDAESTGVMLLADMKALLENRERIMSIDLVAQLAGKEDRPWPEYHDGRPITARQIARLLKPFGIRPASVRDGDDNAKGYKREQFRDAFTRYLPTEGVNDPSQRHNVDVARLSEDFDPSHRDPVVTNENSPKPRRDVGCDVVTDEKPAPCPVEVF